MNLSPWTGVVLLAFLVGPGCATAPPRDSIWEAIPPLDESQPTEPLDLPQLPTFAPSENGQNTVSPQGGRELLQYIEAAEGNQEIAWAHTDQITELRTAINALARAGQAEHDLAELRLRILEEERRAHFWSRIQDWVLIGLLGLAAAR